MSGLSVSGGTGYFQSFRVPAHQLLSNDKGTNSDFTMVESSKRSLTQRIQVNITNNGTHQYYVLPVLMPLEYNFCGISVKICNLSPIMRKCQTN